MKSLNSLRQLMFICISLVITTFTMACIYSDLILNSTSYMEYSEIKFEKRLDDNYERFVASKHYAVAEVIPKIKASKQIKIKRGKHEQITEQPQVESNIAKEEKVEILTAGFSKFQDKPFNLELKDMEIDRNKSEISVEVSNNKIIGISSFSIVSSNKSLECELQPSAKFNANFGLFNYQCSDNSAYSNGALVSFDNDSNRLTVRFSTGILQDATMIFTNSEVNQEVAEASQENKFDNQNPDQAYEDLVRREEAAAVEAASEQPQQLAFQTREEALRDRLSPQAQERPNQDVEETDDQGEPVESEERGNGIQMEPVELEHASGFSFKPNNERI